MEVYISTVYSTSFRLASEHKWDIPQIVNLNVDTPLWLCKHHNFHILWYTFKYRYKNENKTIDRVY